MACHVVNVKKRGDAARRASAQDHVARVAQAARVGELAEHGVQNIGTSKVNLLRADDRLAAVPPREVAAVAIDHEDLIPVMHQRVLFFAA